MTDTADGQIRVVVADDHPVVLLGLRSIIEDSDTLALAGSARDGEEAVDLVASIRPDVVVLDVRMPRCDGLEAARRILAIRPETRIVLLSAWSDLELGREALEAGALGFVPKEAVAAHLVQTIELVMEGRAVMPPDMVRFLARDPKEQPATTPLSPREREIVTLLAEGKTNEQIASALGNSVSTVKGQLSALFDKVGAVDRASALASCFRKGWIS